MARQLRISFPGALYHVMARGNAKQAIFLDDQDHRLFLEELWKVCEHRNWLVWAYCLMGNHYHLLLQTLWPNLPTGMRDLNGTFAGEFNKRHKRVGHVMQGRYVAKLVDARSYLLQVSRYIVLNPVRAQLCRWPRSGAGRAMRTLQVRGPASIWLAATATLELFDDDRERARTAYERYVLAGIGEKPPETHPENPLVYGDDEFLRQVTIDRPAPSPEVPLPQRVDTPLTEFDAAVMGRNDAIRAAFARRTFSQKLLADHYGVHYSTVSRVLGRGPRSRTGRTAIQDVTPASSGPK